MSCKTEFPTVHVPDQFFSPMFDDISCANNCECPTFIVRGSVADDHHYIKVLVDSIGVRFRAIRHSAYFEPELICEADTVREFFVWLLKSINNENKVLLRMALIFYLLDRGFLSEYPDIKKEAHFKGYLENKIFQVVGYKRLFLSMTSGGFVELRDKFLWSHSEVDRLFRNDRLLENLNKVEFCLGCEMFYFEEGKKCKCHK